MAPNVTLAPNTTTPQNETMSPSTLTPYTTMTPNTTMAPNVTLAPNMTTGPMTPSGSSSLTIVYISVTVDISRTLAYGQNTVSGAVAPPNANMSGLVGTQGTVEIRPADESKFTDMVLDVRKATLETAGGGCWRYDVVRDANVTKGTIFHVHAVFADMTALVRHRASAHAQRFTSFDYVATSEKTLTTVVYSDDVAVTYNYVCGAAKGAITVLPTPRVYAPTVVGGATPEVPASGGSGGVIGGVVGGVVFIIVVAAVVWYYVRLRSAARDASPEELTKRLNDENTDAEELKDYPVSQPFVPVEIQPLVVEIPPGTESEPQQESLEPVFDMPREVRQFLVLAGFGDQVADDLEDRGYGDWRALSALELEDMEWLNLSEPQMNRLLKEELPRSCRGCQKHPAWEPCPNVVIRI